MLTDELEATYSAESRHVLATLVRLLGSFELAEDALHEAFLAAAEQWPRDGMPRNPRAWLISIGRFAAIDTIRRRARYDASLQRLARETTVTSELNLNLNHVPDDDLRLIFLCCHPALSIDAQIALTLREACGLTTEEIAQAFLVKPSAIAQRIVRAKGKIRAAVIPYDLPDRLDLPERLNGVLHVVYLLFNEGYDASFGGSLLRKDLCVEGIRLAQLVAKVLPDAEALGLVALMLFHHARRKARTDGAGELILLENQDRSLWDREDIARARSVLKQALSQGPLGRYTCQASIAAIHAESPSGPETNWSTIVRLYDVLMELGPSAIVELNRAVAVAMRDGPAMGLALIEDILSRGELRDYRFAHAARADFYRRLGRMSEARAAYMDALHFTHQNAERRFIARRIAELDQ